MLYPTRPTRQWRQVLLWAMLPVLILSLALAAACGGEDPAAAPGPSAADIAAAQETAEQARSAAAAAQAAADAAQAAADQAMARAEGAEGTGAEEAARTAASEAQATADQAKATAEAARAAAEAAQAAAQAAQEAVEEVARRGEDRPSITVIGGDEGGTGTGTGHWYRYGNRHCYRHDDGRNSVAPDLGLA